MYLPAECAPGIDPQRLFRAAVEQGVLFVPGAALHPGMQSTTCMRLSCAAPDVSQIREGVHCLARAFRSILPTTADQS